MYNRIFSLLTAALICSAEVFGQTTAPGLAFEVASVKPAEPLDPQKIMSGQMRVGMKVDAALVTINSLSLSDLIMIAFRIKPYQLSGPNWLTAGGMNAERFDIQAKLPEGATTDQVPEMLQALLVERFKLTFHRDKTDHNVYALVVGKNGPKLKESPPDEAKPAEADPGADKPQAASAPPPPPTQPAGTGGSGGVTSFGMGNPQLRITGNMQSGMVIRDGSSNGAIKMTMGQGGSMHMEASKMTMEALAQMLTRFGDRPVVDMTELKGNYQVALDLSMEEMMNAARASGAGGAGMVAMRSSGGGEPGRMPADIAAEPSGGGSIFHSVQQLGLKLETRKAPLDRIVIDRLERQPTEN